VLRIAGRFRRRLRWHEDRVKIPLKDVVHARVNGSQVNLWLRNAQEARLQRISLELFTHETAGELVDWLPVATPFPEMAASDQGPTPQDGGVLAMSVDSAPNGLWVAIAGATLVVALMLVVLLLRRGY
jgi:hypothetical protein